MSRTKKIIVEEKIMAEKKINVEKFLQLHPQSYTIATLLRTKYKSKVMTESEWLELVSSLLGTQVRRISAI